MGLFDKKKKQEEQEQPISPEESQMRHQSAPQPTAQDEAMKIRALQQQKMMEGQGVAPNGAVNKIDTTAIVKIVSPQANP